MPDPQLPEPGQCAKDSDCGIGEVCANGRCVPDIAPPPPIITPNAES